MILVNITITMTALIDLTRSLNPHQSPLELQEVWCNQRSKSGSEASRRNTPEWNIYRSEDQRKALTSWLKTLSWSDESLNRDSPQRTTSSSRVHTFQPWKGVNWTKVWKLKLIISLSRKLANLAKTTKTGQGRWINAVCKTGVWTLHNQLMKTSFSTCD